MTAPRLASEDSYPAPQPYGALAMSEFRRRIEGELSYLRRIARHWQRERAGAEDLVQDTVLRALAGAHLFAAGSNLRAWLLAIMRNLFLGAAAAGAREMPMPEGFAEADSEATPHPGEGRLVLRDLERALSRLPEKQRAIILAVGVDGKTYEEVARTLGTSVAAVRCHLARARDRLRTAIEGGEFHPWFSARTDRTPSPLLAAVRSGAGSFALFDAE